jgi:hypothetical protein
MAEVLARYIFERNDVITYDKEQMKRDDGYHGYHKDLCSNLITITVIRKKKRFILYCTSQALEYTIVAWDGSIRKHSENCFSLQKVQKSDTLTASMIDTFVKNNTPDISGDRGYYSVKSVLKKVSQRELIPILKLRGKL